jgi:hypothetical protein
MKIMKRQLKWKHRIILGGCALFVLAYFGSYLWLRMNHTFIHRAGRYAPRISRNETRPRRSTNHFVEPGQVADGPQIFAGVMFVAAAVSETHDLSDVQFEKMLESAAQQVESMERKRDRLFLLYEPAAFCETMVWKVIDPDPLTRRYEDAEHTSLPYFRKFNKSS